MTETAVNLPLDGSEIRQIILQRLEKRMELNSVLAIGIAYPGFEYDLTFVIKVDHPSVQPTTVWDRGKEGSVGSGAQEINLSEKYASKTPNVERQDNGLDLTIETTNAKGKKDFKKIRIKT